MLHVTTFLARGCPNCFGMTIGLLIVVALLMLCGIVGTIGVERHSSTTCGKCGNPMVRKDVGRKRREIYRCVNFPNCPWQFDPNSQIQECFIRGFFRISTGVAIVVAIIETVDWWQQ